ncbi:MAG TPA: hypothetical protein VHS53_08620, partial [Mucilaginibacter sp.]|nr:hypothetical protein [Mucilaginibacter sp.]
MPFFTKAQNGVYYIPSAKQADSVRKALSRTNNDTLKMSAYYYLSSYYTELNKDSAEYYGDLQLSMAKKLNQKLWAADACFQAGYITYGLGNYPKSLNRITEGLEITDDQGSEKNNWHVNVFSGDGSPHRARLFIAASLHQIFSYLYSNAGDSRKSLAELLTAVKIAESADNKEELSLDYMSLGNYYLNKSDSVLFFENKALKYAYQSNYKIYIGAIYTTIGDVYFAKKDYATADKYYHKSVAASISQDNLKDEIDA